VGATGQAYAGKEWPASGLRGVTTKLVAKTVANTQNPGAVLAEETAHKLRQWGVNLLRVELEVDEAIHGRSGNPDPPRPGDDDLLPYRNHLQALEHVLALAEKHQFYVLLIAPKIQGRGSGMLYAEKGASGYHRHLVATWRRVAERFGSHPRLIGYDFLGEPHGSNEVEFWYGRLLPEIVKAVREVDRDSYVIVESVPWALAEGYRNMKPLDDPKVVYSFHFYAPHGYTHQGVGPGRAETAARLTYPGVLQMFPGSSKIWWDKEQLRRYVQPVRAFQQKYGARVLVGEVGVIRWAPGGAQWLSDAISLFEELGWSWCFHSYGGWNGWNPTFDASDPAGNSLDGGKVTEQLRVLIKGWRRNVFANERTVH
jgi:hypothetical protein